MGSLGISRDGAAFELVADVVGGLVVFLFSLNFEFVVEVGGCLVGVEAHSVEKSPVEDRNALSGRTRRLLPLERR